MWPLKTPNDHLGLSDVKHSPPSTRTEIRGALSNARISESINQRVRLYVLQFSFPFFALTFAWSCDFGTTGSPIEAQERERFISAYVDMRLSSLRMRTLEISDAVKDSIFRVHDVTEDELLNFVETHGADVGFMREVWNEIETRISENREEDATYGR